MSYWNPYCSSYTTLTSAPTLHYRPKTRYAVSHLDGFPLQAVVWLLWSMSDRVKDAFVVVQLLKEPFWAKTKAGAMDAVLLSEQASQ